MRPFLVAIAMLAMLSQPRMPAAQDRPTSTVETGTLTGVVREGMRQFLGVPFAAPPVGALRWRPPQPALAWSGARDATRFGPACAQALLRGFNDELVPGSEDCLTLNVYAPPSGERLPVMVWIPGGAHSIGAGSEPIYTPTALVSQGVIVVTINYRLGRLGFFAAPAILAEAEARGEPTGNYGMMDQIAALAWVRRNIAAFGGDPERVTIFGESAGGRSVTWLMVSEPARGLFQRAIAESGRATEPLRGTIETRHGLQPQRDIDAGVAAGLGATTAEALRALPVERLLASVQDLSRAGFGPFVDGRIIPGDPVPLFAAGRQARVPFLIGTNSWDASLFAGNLPSLDSVLAGLGPDRAEAERLYRPAGDDRRVIFEMLQDQRFNATLKLLAGSMQGHAPAYGYFFDYLTAARRGVFPGVPHGWELNYVFGSLDRAPALGAFRPGDAADFVPAADPASAEDRAMSRQVAAAWAAFARTGDPNVPGQPRWPAYDPAADTVRHFAREAGLITGLRREAVAFQMRRLRATYGLPH